MNTFPLNVFAISGRKAKASIAYPASQNDPLTQPDDTAYKTIGEMSEASASPSNDNQDVTVLGQKGWMNRMFGMKDNSFSASGYFNPRDVGQLMVLRSFMEDLYVWVRLELEDGTGFEQCALVSTPGEPSASADGVQETSLEFDGNGELHLVGIDLSEVAPPAES